MKPPRTFTVPELVLWSLIVWCIAMVVAAIIISERAW